MHNNHSTIIPLIIDGDDYLLDNKDRLFNTQSFGKTTSYDIRVQGADLKSCHLAVDSCAQAFESWRDSSPQYRREIFLRLAALLQSKGAEVRSIMEEEINCSPLWSLINLEDSIKNIQEAAALVTSPALRGTIPQVFTPNSQALVLKEPLGVILGIAPWNSPIILCSRAVVAPIAAGNTAILKGSELSPRTHYFIAKLFQEAGFPRGVLNFILHREEDAPEIFKALIERKEVRKCNFTGSTPVGRVIASQAAMSLKPVLLELGGKNFVVVLEDADLDIAARLVIEGAFLNSGQICMSTDIVLIAEPIMEAFKKKVFAILESPPAELSITPVISDKSFKRLKQLLDDAVSKGATLAEFHQITSKAKSIALIDVIPATIICNLDPSMAFYSQEAFGPLLGLMAVTSIAEAARIINTCPFGLSASILTHKHFEALKLAKKLRVGAIHVNGSTVHDESILPHGGYGDSGWGRFGADWGMDEWLQTKTVILNE